MSQPPNSTPPAYGQPPGHGGPPPQNSGYPQQPGVRGMTRQMLNPATYKRPGSGSWAAASLTLALIGWVTLGCLGVLTWPLGLLFGLIGMIGHKRAKGLSFAGFLLSGIGLAGFVAVFALGLWQLAWTENYADQGGAPVVAAVAEFKADHDRVPFSLDELVEGGYLPTRWEHGLDGLDEEVRDVVKGQRWADFLAYAPGKDADWKGTPDGIVNINAGLDGVSINVPEEVGEKPQSYGLVFIGADGSWGTYDDTPVNQAPENPYNLAQVWDADAATADAMTKQRRLKAMLKRVDERLGSLQLRADSAEEELEKYRQRLREIADSKGLTRDQLRADPDAGEWVTLIGETARRLKLTQEKRTQLEGTRTRLEVRVARIGNRVELSRIAENEEERAELQRLLDETQETLDANEKRQLTLDVTDEELADEWLRENFN